MLGGALENMRMQSSQVPLEMKLVFDYLLQKLEKRVDVVSETEVSAEGVVEPLEEVETERPAEPIQTSQPTTLVLTPQQRAQADQFLLNISAMELSDLVPVYTTLQGVANSVPVSDRPVVAFILAKLAVRIAELEQQEDK